MVGLTSPARIAVCQMRGMRAGSDWFCLVYRRHSAFQPITRWRGTRSHCARGTGDDVFLVPKGAFRGPEWDRGTSLLVRVGYGPRFGVELGAIWGASIILLGLGHLEGDYFVMMAWNE